MKTITLKVKVLAICGLFSLFSLNTFAQVGIGTTTPNGGAALDITSTNKGLLIPRVSLSSLTSLAPITGGQEPGMLVYNTNNATTKGFYYWNSNTVTGNWIPVAGSSTTSNGWLLNGNSGTSPGTDFIGTTDYQALQIKTNGNERIRITEEGKVGIGVNPWSKLDVVSNVFSEPGLYVTYSGTSTRAAGQFENFNEAGGNGVAGIGYYGVFGSSTNPFNGGYGGYFNGKIYTSMTLFEASDKRFKSNIVSLNMGNDVLKKVMQLSPKSYNWRASEFPGMNLDPNKKSFGFIAQELNEIFPELVDTGNIPDPKIKLGPRDEIQTASGYYSVNYTGLIPILTEAIQEQQQIINLQEERITKLETLVQELINKR